MRSIMQGWRILVIGLDVDDLKLYIGDDYIINDSIKVLQPTIRQIAEFGERDFFSVVHTVTAIPSDMKSQLWDMGLDWTEVDDFELFVMLVQTLTLDRTELLFGNIDLSKLRPYKHPNIEDEIIKLAKDKGIRIDFVKMCTAFLLVSIISKSLFNSVSVKSPKIPNPALLIKISIFSLFINTYNSFTFCSFDKSATIIVTFVFNCS